MTPRRLLALCTTVTFLTLSLCPPSTLAALSVGTSSLSLPRDPTTRFVYDGDGGRVKSITTAGTTLFLGQSYEVGPDPQNPLDKWCRRA